MSRLIDPRVTNAIAIVVLVLWVVNFLARFAVKDWEPSVAVDGAMTLVLGAALWIGRKNGGDK